jgi:cytochrome c556
MKKSAILLSALLLASALPAISRAQEEPSPQELAEKATLTRQAVFKLMYFNLMPVYMMVRGNEPFDAAIAERNARRMASLAPMIPDVFAASDTREFEVTTKALDKIWETPDDLAERAMELVKRANAFADIAAAGDKDATIGAFRSLSGGCGNCHDVYKQEDD